MQSYLFVIIKVINVSIVDEQLFDISGKKIDDHDRRLSTMIDKIRIRIVL